MKLFKNPTFYLSALAIIATIVGVVFTTLSSNVQGYMLTELTTIYVCAIIAVVLLIAGIICSQLIGAHSFIVYILNLAAMVLLCVAFGEIIMGRAVLASAQFSYDSVNTVGWGVLYQSIAGLALFLVADILILVESLLKGQKA